MKKSLFLIGSLIAAVTMFSCAEDAIEPGGDAPEVAGTRVDNPIPVMVYAENINPLNALTYVKTGTTTPFIDILNIFAANINRSGNDPSIHFNTSLAGYMDDLNQYIHPLQAKGMKVNMALMPNWQNFGPANLSGSWNDPNSQVRRFARLVAYVVQQYDFDGVTIDDEYAAYTYLVNGSYGQLIHALRAEFDRVFPGEHKLITVFSWGNTGQIDSAAGAKVDYADHASYNTWVPNPQITGVARSQWMPAAFSSIGPSITEQAMRLQVNQVKTGGYGGVSVFSLGGNGVSQPVLNAIAQSLAGDVLGRTTQVSWTGVSYPAGPSYPGGVTITNADVPSNF